TEEPPRLPTIREQGSHGAALFVLFAFFAVARNSGLTALPPGPDAFGYTVEPTSQFSFLQITNPGTARVLWFDDDTAFTANIGFAFRFYGSEYSTVSF